MCVCVCVCSIVRDLELAEGLVNAARKSNVVDSKVAFIGSERRRNSDRYTLVPL